MFLEEYTFYTVLNMIFFYNTLCNQYNLFRTYKLNLSLFSQRYSYNQIVRPLLTNILWLSSPHQYKLVRDYIISAPGENHINPIVTFWTEYIQFQSKYVSIGTYVIIGTSNVIIGTLSQCTGFSYDWPLSQP